MIISLALVLLATAGGTLATYLYDDDAPFGARLCSGACIGIATLGLVGFIFAAFIGLTPLTILLTLGVLVLPAFSLRQTNRRNDVQRDLRATYRAVRQGLFHPRRLPLGYIVFYLIVAVILWHAFQRAMIDLPEGIYTGVRNNLGDLPFHLSVITSFAYGNNFLPEDPTYAGVRFTYPFLTDFVSAIFVRCGASLRQSMFIENFVVGLAFVGVVHRWALAMLRNRLAAILTPILVLLNGGLGWVMVWKEVSQSKNSFTGILSNLPPSLTIIQDTTWRWGNALSTLLIPQRGFLLGLPLAIIVFTQWWLSDDKAGERDSGEKGKGERGKGKEGKNRKKQKNGQVGKSTAASSRGFALFPFSPVSPFSNIPLSMKRMMAAGIVAGLLPLVHAHSFVVVMAVGACLALLQRRWRPWLVFFIAASLIALPQMWWSTHNSAVDASKFFEWQYGWDRGKEDAIWFWFKNAGLFIPLTLAALIWKDKEPLVSHRLSIFFLPFTLCFIIPNVLKMAPWIWDNIKVLFYWWLASAPLVALLLARFWQQGKVKRVIAIILFACVTAAGAWDVAGIVVRSSKYQIFDASGVKFAQLIKENTEPRALMIHAPTYNHPVFLTGRKSLMGYPGHIWTHGLDYTARESEIRRVYAGAPDAGAILRKYGVAYAVVSPLERNLMNVNDQFFSEFELIGEAGEYRLYKIAAR